MIARWNGTEWKRHPITTSDNNYDFGELWMVASNDWRIIGLTETGPQPFNMGVEVAMWQSTDGGESWKKIRQLTSSSEMNHTYIRRPLNAHPDFFALWADGHGRKPSESRLYFADREGNVRVLSRQMNSDSAVPETVFQVESKD